MLIRTIQGTSVGLYWGFQSSQAVCFGVANSPENFPLKLKFSLQLVKMIMENTDEMDFSEKIWMYFTFFCSNHLEWKLGIPF